MSIRVKQIELMLLGWRETHNSGFTVTFAVAPEDGEFFKAKTVAKGKIAGQIFMAALAEVDGAKPAATDWKPLDPPLTDTERSLLKLPSKSHFPGGLCGLAARWCQDSHFQEWIYTKFPGLTTSAPAAIGEGSDMAKYVVCAMCKIDSRKQLDTAPGADILFRSNFLEPYAAARRADGIDDE